MHHPSSPSSIISSSTAIWTIQSTSKACSGSVSLLLPTSERFTIDLVMRSRLQKPNWRNRPKNWPRLKPDKRLWFNLWRVPLRRNSKYQWLKLPRRLKKFRRMPHARRGLSLSRWSNRHPLMPRQQRSRLWRKLTWQSNSLPQRRDSASLRQRRSRPRQPSWFNKCRQKSSLLNHLPPPKCRLLLNRNNQLLRHNNQQGEALQLMMMMIGRLLSDLLAYLISRENLRKS